MQDNERQRILRTLKDARETISDEKNWSKEVSARDKFGRACDPRIPQAVSFDIYAALESVAGALLVREAEKELLQTLRSRGDNVMTTAGYNDRPSTTHADVLGVFDATIERLEKGRADAASH